MFSPGALHRSMLDCPTKHDFSNLRCLGYTPFSSPGRFVSGTQSSADLERAGALEDPFAEERVRYLQSSFNG